MIPTFTHIWAVGRFAHGMQIQAARQLFQVMIIFAGGGARLQPFGLGCGGLSGGFNLDQIHSAFTSVYCIACGTVESAQPADHFRPYEVQEKDQVHNRQHGGLQLVETKNAVHAEGHGKKSKRQGQSPSPATQL